MTKRMSQEQQRERCGFITGDAIAYTPRQSEASVAIGNAIRGVFTGGVVGRGESMSLSVRTEYGCDTWISKPYIIQTAG